MARLPRSLLVEEGSTNHCTWRSHGHALVLDSDEARLVFLALLRKYKEKFGITIHSYCLMGTHPHVMCRSEKGQRAFSDFWKLVNWGFARWYNRRTQGRGQVVMERLRSPRIQDGRHQLATQRVLSIRFDGLQDLLNAACGSKAASWFGIDVRHARPPLTHPALLGGFPPPAVSCPRAVPGPHRPARRPRRGGHELPGRGGGGAHRRDRLRRPLHRRALRGRRLRPRPGLAGGAAGAGGGDLPHPRSRGSRRRPALPAAPGSRRRSTAPASPSPW